MMEQAGDDFLPGVLGEIAEVAGRDAARKLAIGFGGSRIRIPGRLRTGNWLTECVGQEAAEMIVEHFRVLNADGKVQEMEIVLPIAFAGSIARARRIARATVMHSLEAGEGVRTAAKRAGLTERAAWDIKRRHRRREDGQGELF